MKLKEEHLIYSGFKANYEGSVTYYTKPYGQDRDFRITQRCGKFNVKIASMSVQLEALEDVEILLHFIETHEEGE